MVVCLATVALRLLTEDGLLAAEWFLELRLGWVDPVVDQRRAGVVTALAALPLAGLAGVVDDHGVVGAARPELRDREHAAAEVLGAECAVVAGVDGVAPVVAEDEDVGTRHPEGAAVVAVDRPRVHPGLRHRDAVDVEHAVQDDDPLPGQPHHPLDGPVAGAGVVEDDQVPALERGRVRRRRDTRTTSPSVRVGAMLAEVTRTGVTTNVRTETTAATTRRRPAAARGPAHSGGAA